MKALRLTVILVSGVVATGAVQGEDLEPRVAASRTVVGEFMGQLKSELQAAMKSGGPVNAIEVCHRKAPAIATAVSEDKGWVVGRTALKYRNPDNAPDSWERSVLERFEAQKADGQDPTTLEYFEVVEANGSKSFRYMKAIPTGGVCLACHGKQIAPDVATKLKDLYPEDQATGFAQGDIRGAFTIQQPM